ncbi:MAG TPA: hypothetical protein VEZ72_22665, partial [Paenibacillus sp.]|nr:hypothetical protein [Paenibacillus sp.]
MFTPTTDPVLAFARAEWSRLSALRPETDAPPEEVEIALWSETLSREAGRMSPDVARKMEASALTDDYIILDRADRLVLAGKSDRAALYAVYQYAREAWGLWTAYPGTEPTFGDAAPRTRAAAARFYSPRFERRGFVIENHRDPAYIKLLIDWLPKNGLNEIFFTFMLWDAVRDEVAPEIAKRGLRVTLGGHSMKFFTDRSASFRAMEGDNPYTAKRQFDYADDSWFPDFFEQVADYCRSVPNLTSLSLWPEDVADDSGKGFLGAYVRFAERLKAHLSARGVDVDVEHIAYNAGLSWDMLELGGDTPASGSVDTLFAYWGRDYRHGYDSTPHEEERRARRSLEAWASAVRSNGRRLTIFEYYSDHFMLSSLFPAMPNRIADDVAYYEQLGVAGMVDLIVPYKGPLDYPWEWAHGFNSFVFARSLWERALDSILEEYYSGYPAPERASVRALFERIEATVTEATRWNVPLFPARAVDVERASATREQADAVVGLLRRIRDALPAAPAFADDALNRYVRCLREQAE